MFESVGSRDDTIVARVLEGRHEQFGILVQRYLPVVQAIAYARLGNRADVDDAAQEAFLQAYRNLDRLRERQKFCAWLAIITRNVVNRMQRLRGKEQEAVESSAPADVMEAPDFVRMELRKAVRDQIELLDPESREVLLLKYFADKSSQEIAAILEQSDAAVRKRLQRARATLGERLLEEFKQDDSLNNQRKFTSRKILGTVLAAGAAWSTSNTVAAAASGTLAGTAMNSGSPLLGASGLMSAKAVVSIVAGLLVCGAAVFAVSRKPSTHGTLSPVPSATRADTILPAAHANESTNSATNATNSAGQMKTTDIAVSGRILRTDGTPVTDAVVYGAYHGHEPRVPRATGESDANGAYTLYLDEPWPDFRVWGMKEGFVALNHVPFDATRKGVTGANCVLYREAIIRGVTVAKNGSALGGMPISAYNRNDAAYQQLFQSKSNESGEFTLDGLPPGTYSLAVTSDISFNETSKAMEIEIKEGDAIEDLRVTYDGDGLVITGHVTTEDGAPLSGVSVGISRVIGSPEPWFETPSVKTDEDGYYRLTHVPPGVRPVQASKEGYAYPSDRHVEGGTEDVDFVMRRLARVSGRVIDATTKQPVGSAEVCVASTHLAVLESDHAHMFSPVDGEKGLFDIDGACLGKATVIAKAKDYMPSLLQIELDSGQHLEDVTLELFPGLTLNGYVVDVAGTPIPDTFILLGTMPFRFAADTRPLAETLGSDSRATSAQDGSFTVSGLAPGPLLLSAYHKGYASASTQVTVSQSPVQPPVRFVLSKGGVIRGVVRVGETPQKSAFVVATLADTFVAASNEVQANDDGTFELLNVCPGEVEVRARVIVWPIDFNGRSASRLATVTDGKETVVNFDLLPDVGSIDVHIEMAGNQKLHGLARCLTSISGGNETHLALLRDGVFRFEQVPAGIVRGDVAIDPSDESGTGNKPSSRTKRFEVTVQPNENATVSLRFAGESVISGRVTGVQPTERAVVNVLEGNRTITIADLPIRYDPGEGFRVGTNAVAPDGSYRIDGLDAGTYTVVAVAEPDVSAFRKEFSRFSTSVIQLADSETATLDIDIK